MPRATLYTLLWSPSQETYLLRGQDQQDCPLRQEDDETWYTWLAGRSAFSFQGKHGQLNLLKEARVRGGEGYWYAYRRQGRRMRKKYVGRDSELTIARLEALAVEFNAAEGEAAAHVGGAQGEMAPGSMQAGAMAEEQGRQVVSQPAVTASSGREQALLLTSKLHLPRLHASLIERERLLLRLDAVLQQTLTLLAAPAGFGKTTLARQWIATREARGDLPPVAWVSLDAGDNDPIRFWRYVITACQVFQPDPSQAALAQLADLSSSSFKASPLETALAVFLNDLMRCERGGILVLEDYHVIIEPQLHEMLTFFLDHLPAFLHVILLTRSVPPLPLARLRARGDLGELHAADLRFSLEETTAFLWQSLALTPAQLPVDALKQLDAHLEGWAAGLRLLTLALQGHTRMQEIEQILTTFAGGHRTLQEYFVMEVLNAQSAPLQDFLLRTSILARLTGSLCDAITGRGDSAQVLASLDHAGLFVEPLDEAEEWYRYHALFAEAMQREARSRLGAEELRTLSSKASLWFEQHELFPDAIEAALQAKDMERVALLIEQLVGEQALDARPPARNPEVYTLRRWLAQLPEDLLYQRPVLCSLYALILLIIRIMDERVELDTERVEKLLWAAEQAWRREGNAARLAEICAFRALLTRVRGDLMQAVAWARQALVDLPEEVIMWRSLSLRIVGLGELFSGQLNTARRVLLEALPLSEASGSLPFLRGNILLLCRVYGEQGELHRAAEDARRMLVQAREMDDHDDICNSLLLLAHFTYEWNDLQTAELQALEALELARQLRNPEFQGSILSLLARIEHARGETAAALRRLDSLLDSLPVLFPRPSPSRNALAQELLAWQARFQLACGDLSSVQRWVSSREQRQEAPPWLQYEREELLVARWLIAQERGDEALTLLTRLLEATRQTGAICCALEIQVLIALAYAAQKQMQEARSALHEVLAQAHSEGYVRLFLDEGEPVAALLRSLMPFLREKHLLIYARTLLDAFAQEHGKQQEMPPSISPSLSEPLSSQEQRVLRLLSAGRTNAEIASELVVSVNTVKTHLQRIYRKLGVLNRHEARDQARQLRLV